MHKNNTRISLLYFTGSVFTFDIRPIAQDKRDKNKWFGKNIDDKNSNDGKDKGDKF